MKTSTDVVRDLYAKLSAGDALGALALMTDDIEWIPMMDFRIQGRGPQKVLEGMLIPAMSMFDSFRLTPSEFVTEGNRVVSIGRFKGKVLATGKQVDVAYAHMWEVSGGKIARFRQFIDTAAIDKARTS